MKVNCEKCSHPSSPSHVSHTGRCHRRGQRVAYGCRRECHDQLADDVPLHASSTWRRERQRHPRVPVDRLPYAAPRRLGWAARVSATRSRDDELRVLTLSCTDVHNRLRQHLLDLLGFTPMSYRPPLPRRCGCTAPSPTSPQRRPAAGARRGRALPRPDLAAHARAAYVLSLHYGMHGAVSAS